MFRISLLAVAFGFLMSVGGAYSASAHKGHGQYLNHKHYRAAKVHYGGKHHLGYWRRGPVHGPRFGFSSYRGDPFGGDDYYDGRRCYVVNHENFCVANRIFNGFFDLPTVR